METFSWRSVAAVDLGELRLARAEIHRAIQWLARVAYAYVPPQPDDRQASLVWDNAFRGFVTEALPDGARLGLRLADLTLAFIDGGSAVQVFALDGRVDVQARAWLGAQMAKRGCDPGALGAPLPYQAPAGGAAYRATGLARSFEALAVWCANADAVLAATRRDIVARNLDASEVRLWPHHLDLDSVVTVAPGRTTGVGFSLGDHFYEEPYFYVNIRPKREIAALPRLPAIGHWHDTQFTGAIATASRITAAKDQGRDVEAFLREATTATIAALR